MRLHEIPRAGATDSSPASPILPAPSQGDTLTLLRHPPPHPHLRRGIPRHFCRHPPPRPRLRRSSPAPSRGRGPCVAISGEQPCPGWSRRETVFGVEPGESRIRGGAGGKPYLGWSRRETVSGSSPGSPHAVDRGDIAIGGGADGEGELVPPPLSPTLQPSYFSPASLARAFAGRLPTHFCRHPHPTRAFGAPPPPHPGGGVRAWRYQVSSRIRGGAGGKPCPG